MEYSGVRLGARPGRPESSQVLQETLGRSFKVDLSRASPRHLGLETARSGSLVASWPYEVITFKTDFLSPVISFVHAIASLSSFSFPILDSFHICLSNLLLLLRSDK